MNPTTIKIVVAVAAMTLAGYGGYKFGRDSVMADWQSERAEINKATANALIRMQELQNHLETQLRDNEAKAWKEYQNAQSEADRLAGELANRPWRVRVERPACGNLPGDSGAASVGDGKEYEAELPAETSRRIIEIARDADRCEAKLNALQGYIDSILPKR